MNRLERELEDIITQKRIDEWYTSSEYTWDSLKWYSAGQLRNIFFPKSILQELYVHYEESKWAKNAFEFNSGILSEEEDSLISVYNLTFDREALTAERFFRIRFGDSFFSFARTSCLDSSQLRHEFLKLNKVYFVQRDSVGSFLRKSCPLLFSCLTEYRILNKL